MRSIRNDKRNYTIEDLEELLDNIPYELYIKNIDGEYIYANKSTIDRIGKRKEEVIGKNDYELRPYKMAKICVDGDKAVLRSGEKTFIEDKVIDGNVETSYEIFKTILHNKEENDLLIGGIAKFITEDKEISKRIIENSNIIMNNMNELDINVIYNEILSGLKSVIDCDDITLYLFNDSEKVMELYNHFGNNKDIFLKKYCISNAEKLLYYNNFECKIIKKLSQNKVKYIYILKNVNKLVGCIHIYYENKPKIIKEEFIRFICIVLSFIETNRSLANILKEELINKNEAQQKLQMMIDGIIDVYAIVRKVENEIQWIEISKRCNEIIGWNVDELNSRKYIEFIHPKDRYRVRSRIEMRPNGVPRGPFTMISKDNRWVTIDATFNHLTEDIYMIAAKDVTTLTELKKDKEELKHAIEIESLKGEFFANLSHEFKTPLNIILSVVQLIMNYIKINNKYPSIENFNRYLGSIKQNSYRLLKLANNMIDITKIDGDFYQINMGNYNIVDIIENIVQSLVVYMKDNKRNIIFDTMEEEVIMACDPDQIERIILNLLSNAMKFTSPDGNIYVNIDINDRCNKVIIKIGNDGQPISLEDSKKIFERFTQSQDLLTRSIEGSGIGLSISKSLVELHKGIIYVNTEVKEGTEFCIELPIRKIMNSKDTNVREKSIISKVEKFDIEFSDIYN